MFHLILLYKAWQEVNSKVKSLIDSINEAEAQRAIILQENDNDMNISLLDEPKSTYQFISSSNSTDNVSSVSPVVLTPIQKFAKDTNPATGIQKYDPNVFSRISITNGHNIVRVPSEDMRALIEARSAKELMIMVTNVLLVMTTSLLLLSSRFAILSSKFLNMY